MERTAKIRQTFGQVPERRAAVNQRDGMIRWLRDLLCGILIGAGAILPGVSGGVLAVVFDIYRPFMEVLTHPRQALPKYWRWIPALAIGWCVGFMGFAKGICAMLELSDAVTIWLFIGLIVGTLPQLFRETGKEGRGAGAWASFALAFSAMFFGLYYVSRVASFHVRPNVWWYNFCGALWGMGIIIPGFTSSSIMMALDLYQPLMDGLSRLELDVLAAALPGMFLTIFLLARLVSWFFKRYYALASHGILGIVAASTLVIVPTSYTGAGEMVLSAACCGGGFLLAYFLGRLDRKIQKNR